MTLIIAAHGKDFVVLGADSRGTNEGTGGMVQTSTAIKMHPVGRLAVVLICGQAGPASNLVDLLSKTAPKKPEGVRAVATRLARLARREATELKTVPTHPSYFPDFAFIVTGLDRAPKGILRPKTFALRSETGFRLELSQGGREMDGQPLIPEYLFEKQFREEMPLEELCGLVAQAMFDTARINAYVGGRLRMGIVDKDGFRELPLDVVRSYIKEW